MRGVGAKAITSVGARTETPHQHNRSLDDPTVRHVRSQVAKGDITDEDSAKHICAAYGSTATPWLRADLSCPTRRSALRIADDMNFTVKLGLWGKVVGAGCLTIVVSYTVIIGSLVVAVPEAISYLLGILILLGLVAVSVGLVGVAWTSKQWRPVAAISLVVLSGVLLLVVSFALGNN